MREVLMLVLALIAGGGIGALFFGGLWWTVRRGVASPRPALWFLGSLALRLALAAAGFHLVGGGHWKRLLACLCGFVLARLAAARLAGPAEKAAGHAA